MKELIEMVTVDTLGKCKRCGKEDWIDLRLGICSKCFLEIVKQRKFVWLEDLNSALQGLMEDIEAYFDSQINEEDGDISFCHICDRAVSGRKQHIEYHLKPIKDLIRKWFPKYAKVI